MVFQVCLHRTLCVVIIIVLLVSECFDFIWIMFFRLFMFYVTEEGIIQLPVTHNVRILMFDGEHSECFLNVFVF